MRPGGTRLAWAGALVVVGTPLAAWAAPYVDPRAPTGTTLDGLDVSGARSGELYGASRTLADEWLDTPITILASDVALHLSRRELGARASVARTIEDGHVPGASGDPLRDLGALASAPMQLSLTRTFDTDAGLAALDRIRTQVDVAPLAATTDASNRAVPARGGRALRLLSALRELERALLASEAVIELPVQSLDPPAVTPLPLADAIYTRTLSTYSTRYSGSEDQWGRERNITAAAAAIDGAVIAPFEELSFNAVVGARTIERGYRPAEELSAGRIVEGIGGGICQVAATLHAAAFLGGLDIVEHHPHTRTSRYIEVGLDAAVAWPSLDLRIRNPFPFPLRVRASTGGGALTIALLGSAIGPDVRWSAEVERVIPRGREQQAIEGAAPGDVVDEGVDGLVLRRERVFRIGARRVREITRLTYPPVARLEALAP